MQATDIELGGVGFMVAPGTYRREQDGLPEGRTGRVVVRDFFGGQHRAVQLERDRSWDSLDVGPALGGQGVEPWPNVAAYPDAALAVDPPTAGFGVGDRLSALTLGAHAYLAHGGRLYRAPFAFGATWDGLTLVAEVTGAPVTALAYYQGKIAVALGSGADIRLYDPAAPAASALSVFSAGQRAHHAVGYGRRLVYGDATPGNEEWLRFSTGGGIDGRELDAPIGAIGLFGGKVAVATRQSLWLLGGKSDPATGTWTTDPEPFFTPGFWCGDEDYAFLLGYGGRLYAWLGHQVMEFAPGSGSGRQGWRAVGLEGAACYGATVTGGLLVVAIQSALGNSEVWAWDGSGWWLITRVAAGEGATRCWPAATASAGNRDLVVFRAGSGTYDLVRLVRRAATVPTYPPTGQYLSSLLDAGERDKPKAWRAVGACFASPEPRGNPASADPAVALALAYSLDGGRTWTTAATTTATDPAERTRDLTADLGAAAATARFVQLRVSWSGVTDWAPVLVGLWAEYELLDAPARRRRWSFAVHARDAAVGRDGGRLARTGRELAADLWAAWQAGTTLAFKDIDHDTAPTTRQVRIVGLREAIAKPTEAGRWGESVLELVLVEV